jgi:hypothetical protein
LARGSPNGTRTKNTSNTQLSGDIRAGASGERPFIKGLVQPAIASNAGNSAIIQPNLKGISGPPGNKRNR